MLKCNVLTRGDPGWIAQAEKDTNKGCLFWIYITFS